MSKVLDIGYYHPKGAIIQRSGLGTAGAPAILFASGSTVPSDAATGYAPGCIFIDTDAAAGSQFYINEGTAASCDFNVIALGGLSFATLVATAAEINRVADVSTRIVNCTASTLTVTEADHDGKTIVLDRAAGIAVTLPSASAGLKFEFIIKTTFTGAASIKSVVGTDIMIGWALMGANGVTTVANYPSLAVTTNDTIDMLGTANSTGGIAGQRIRITGLATALWYVEIIGDAAGTEATPFANTVT